MFFLLSLACSSGQYHNVSKTGDRVKTSNEENMPHSDDSEADTEKTGSNKEERSNKSESDDDETDDNTATSSEDQENDDNDLPSDENETDEEDNNEENNEDDDESNPPPEDKEDTKLQVEFVDSFSSYACGDDEGNGEITVTVPASAEKGDLLGLFVHRTDGPLYEDADAIADGGLPLVDGIVDNSWKKEAACYMKVNGEPCTEEWRHQDLIQMFLWKVYNEETESYTIQMPAHKKSKLHITPQWATLVVLRNADPNSPVYGTATRSPDGTRKSLFPKVKVPERGYLLLSQSFDDAVGSNVFQPPDNTRSLAYITGDEDEYGCDNDETGFLFGTPIATASAGQEYITNGDGVSTDKDIMMSISIRPKQ